MLSGRHLRRVMLLDFAGLAVVVGALLPIAMRMAVAGLSPELALEVLLLLVQRPHLLMLHPHELLSNHLKRPVPTRNNRIRIGVLVMGSGRELRFRVWTSVEDRNTWRTSWGGKTSQSSTAQGSKMKSKHQCKSQVINTVAYCLIQTSICSAMATFQAI